MMKFILIFSLLFLSCELAVDWDDPSFSDGTILSETVSIPPLIQEKLEGIFKLEKGSNHFGEELALKWLNNKLSVYGSKSGSYIRLNAGHKDSTIYFEGIWRHFLTGNGGLIRLSIDKKTSQEILYSNLNSLSDLIISGAFGNDDNALNNRVDLNYNRPLYENNSNNEFYILAHRGGGRNSDQIGASENSIEMISLSESLGANGIEIDVKLSNDNIPFLYHDDNINLRLTQESLIVGPIEDFTFPQIRMFLKLKNGEQIPSLKEALEHVLYNTNIKLVWLDMKSERNAMSYVIPIQKEIMTLAEQHGRDLEIFIGIPSDIIQDHFLSYTDHENVLSLNELSLDDVKRTNSKIWAPRWTEGIQTSSVNQIHSENRYAFTWTLDQPKFIEEYIKESAFDGILSNHPSIVAYYYYAK